MEKFNKLKLEIEGCQICKEKFGYQPHPVVWGNAKAKIMQIGQAPSATVHQTGKPFSDLSGKKLREDWYQISDADFYNQDNFYITSLAHCYPGKSKSGGDRIPPKCCSAKWLDQEMEIIENEIYIIIGSYAAKQLFFNQDFVKLVFNDQNINGKPAYVLPHPSPLNRRWFKSYPEFEQKRIKEIRAVVKRLISIENS